MSLITISDAGRRNLQTNCQRKTWEFQRLIIKTVKTQEGFNIRKNLNHWFTGLEYFVKKQSMHTNIYDFCVQKTRYQKIPSKMLATVNEDCVNTTIRIICVHAYWPNWYLYIFFFNVRMNHTKPTNHTKITTLIRSHKLYNILLITRKHDRWSK